MQPTGWVLLTVLALTNSADSMGVTPQVIRHLQAPQSKNTPSQLPSTHWADSPGNSACGNLVSWAKGPPSPSISMGRDISSPHCREDPRLIFNFESLYDCLGNEV